MYKTFCFSPPLVSPLACFILVVSCFLLLPLCLPVSLTLSHEYNLSSTSMAGTTVFMLTQQEGHITLLPKTMPCLFLSLRLKCPPSSAPLQYLPDLIYSFFLYSFDSRILIPCCSLKVPSIILSSRPLHLLLLAQIALHLDICMVCSLLFRFSLATLLNSKD